MKGRVLLLVSALVLAGPPAWAAPMVFDVTGVLDGGASVSGTLTIDPVTGVGTAGEITVGAPFSGTFDTLQSQGTQFAGTYQLVLNAGLPFPLFFAILPVTSLIGYSGGSLCSLQSLCPGDVASVLAFSSVLFSLESGSVTPAAAVPEPGTLLLMASGLLGAGLRRLAVRFRRD